MSFTAIDTSLPSGDTLAQAIGKINDGFQDTLREIVLGAVSGWSWALEGADPAAPTAETWSKGTERVRVEYTYSSGKIIAALYRHSSNSGAFYTNRGTLIYSYDGNGYITSSAWS